MGKGGRRESTSSPLPPWSGHRQPENGGQQKIGQQEGGHLPGTGTRNGEGVGLNGDPLQLGVAGGFDGANKKIPR